MSIDWNFGNDVPTQDFFDELNLDDPAGISEAVESFVFGMEQNRFRTWEAVIRKEQGLPCTGFLRELAQELLNFNGPDDVSDDRVLYINDLPRYSEPWYQILRKIAPRLLLEPFCTFGMHYDVFSDAWPRIVAVIERHGRGLSLPDGIRQPIDVVPVELQHKLWLQFCCDILGGLGQHDSLTLADPDEHYRIDLFIDRLRAHRDSVAQLDLTLDGLLQRLTLPERDRPIFVQRMSEKLGLGGTNEPLGPRLIEQAPALFEPVERVREDEIMQAILHAHPLVRELAVLYFANAHSSDPAIAPLAIRAVEQYGQQEAFSDYRFFSKLVHTQESVTWMIEQVKDFDDESFDFDLDLCYALSTADPALVQPHRHRIERLREMKLRIGDTIADRIECCELDPDQLWQRFEQLVAQPIVDEYPVYPAVEPMHAVARVLAQDKRVASWVLDTLARKADDPGYSVWLEGVAVQLAGQLRLQAATTQLVPLLHDNETQLNGDAMWSLARIGTDAVVDALAAKYLIGGESFRWRAVSVLEDIHSDKSARTLRSWLKVERDEPEVMVPHIISALLAGFIPSAIEPARQQLLAAATPLDEDLTELRINLVALCKLTGTQFSELEAWDQAAKDDSARSDWDEDEDDDLDEDEWDNLSDEEEWDEEEEFDGIDSYRPYGVRSIDDDDRLYERDEYESAERLVPIVNTGPKVGRNDPCPCGSGKKYKKCCLRKKE